MNYFSKNNNINININFIVLSLLTHPCYVVHVAEYLYVNSVPLRKFILYLYVKFRLQVHIKFLWCFWNLTFLQYYNNCYFKKQVLKDENGRLYKLLGERDEEMRILRKARDEEKRALAGENFL